MRILHIDTEMGWRGGENQLRLLLEGLAKAGVESHIAVRPGSAAAARLGHLGTLVQCTMRGGFDPVAAYTLARYCKVHRIQLVDAHTANGHALGLMLKALVPHMKCVVHRRVDNVPRQSFANRLKYLSRRVDRYVAISQAIGGVLLDFGIPAERVSVVRSAVPDLPYRGIDRISEKNALAQAYGINPDLVFIGNASALSPQKGYPTLLQAIKHLKEQGASFHCFIAGDGELRSLLEKMRIELGLEHHVTFMGFIDQVPRFLSALDILAMPSVNEGLGTLLLDGALAGCAIAATRVGGIPEVITHGETGLLSPVNDVLALSHNLLTLISDAALRREFSGKSRIRVAQEFSVAAMVAGNLAVYRSLVSPEKH